MALLRDLSARWRSGGLSVGLVPTMGALHEGHRSLVRRARAECDRVVVSVFVNPAQFAPGEDFDRYPRTPDTDLSLLGAERVDALFVPSSGEMYHPQASTAVRVTGPLAQRLEAAQRPGHFDGVALVVAKLLIAARPDRAYFGRKDAQQCAVVQRLALDLDTGVEIVRCPTVRDPDGLAISSRNRYLSAPERGRALAIPRALAMAARLYDGGTRSLDAILAAARGELDRAAGLHLEYLEAVDPDTFTTAVRAGPGVTVVVAARVGTTRLIDNLSLGDEAADIPHLQLAGPA